MSISMDRPSSHALTADAPLRRGALPIFLLLSAGTGISAGVLSLALPLFALSLSATPAEVGLIRAAAGIGLLCAVLPAGFLVDRHGSKTMFYAGSLGMVLCVAAYRFSSVPSTLVAIAVFEGGFRCLAFNALTATFLQALPRFGMKTVGWSKGALSLGLSFLGPLLAGALLGVADFHTVFGAVIVLMLAPNVLMTLVGDGPPPRAGTGGALASVLSHGGEVAALLRQPNVAACLAAEALVAATFSAFGTFIVVAAVSALGMTPMTASVLAATEGATFILTVFAAGGLIQRLSHRSAVLVGVGISAPSLASLSWAGAVPVLFAAALTLGCGLGLLSLITTSRAGTLPGEKGKVASLFMAAAGLGIAIGPAFGGTVAAWFGVRAVFAAFVPLYVLLAASVRAKARNSIPPSSWPGLSGPPIPSGAAIGGPHKPGRDDSAMGR
jgi:predicted MFS family arabinose efflux permease